MSAAHWTCPKLPQEAINVPIFVMPHLQNHVKRTHNCPHWWPLCIIAHKKTKYVLLHSSTRFNPSASCWRHQIPSYVLAYCMVWAFQKLPWEALHAPNLALLHKTTQIWIKVEKWYIVHPPWYMYTSGPHVTTRHQNLVKLLFYDQCMCMYKCAITTSKKTLT